MVTKGNTATGSARTTSTTAAQATPPAAVAAQATPAPAAQATPAPAAQATPAQATPAQATPAQATPAQATPAQASTYTLHYRRAHPGGGTLGRCSYGVPGVPGIVVFDVALFLPGQPPATITLNVPLAAPAARNVAGVTSAVVAAGNMGVAQATGQPIAAPAAVAAVAAPAAVAALAQAAGAAPAAPAAQ